MIKFDEFGDVVDMVIIDAKLSASTALTSGQNAAKNNIGSTIPKKTVAEIEKDLHGDFLPSKLTQGLEIKILQFYKAIGDGVDNFVDIID